MMKRLVTVFAAILMVVFALSTAHAAALDTTMVVGGGRVEFPLDLDHDGALDEASFGIGAVIMPDGSARGHLALHFPEGWPITTVNANSSSGSVSSEGRVTVSLDAALISAPGEIFKNVPINADCTIAALCLDLNLSFGLSVLDCKAGDTICGDGKYTPPPATLTEGTITIL